MPSKTCLEETPRCVLVDEIVSTGFARAKVRCSATGGGAVNDERVARMKARGDTGQIKRAEQLLGEIQILKAQAQNTDAKLDAILKHLNIEAPPPTASAVTQQPLA